MLYESYNMTRVVHGRFDVLGIKGSYFQSEYAIVHKGSLSGIFPKFFSRNLVVELGNILEK